MGKTDNLFIDAAGFLLALITIEHIVAIIKFIFVKYMNNSGEHLSSERTNDLLLQQHNTKQRFIDKLHKKGIRIESEMQEEYKRHETVIEKKRKRIDYLKHHYNERPLKNYHKFTYEKVVCD